MGATLGQVSSPAQPPPGSDARAPLGQRRIAVLACAAVALLVGSVGSIARIVELGDRAEANGARDWAEREFGGGNSLGADKEALYTARALIPPDAGYRLVVGDPIPDATELTALGLPDFTRHFLLPRRPAADAEWVICYGCDPAQLGGYELVWDGGDGVSVGTVSG